MEAFYRNFEIISFLNEAIFIGTPPFPNDCFLILPPPISGEHLASPHFFSCDSSSIPRFVTHSLTGAELGQSYAVQVTPHGNLMTPHEYLIGPHGSITALSWNIQTMPNQTKPNNTKMDITQSFLKLQAPDFAW